MYPINYSVLLLWRGRCAPAYQLFTPLRETSLAFSATIPGQLFSRGDSLNRRYRSLRPVLRKFREGG